MAKHVWQGNVFEGNPVVPSTAATVTIRDSSNSVIVQTYTDESGLGAGQNPIAVLGGFVRTYLDAGIYNITVSTIDGFRVLENVEVGIGVDSSVSDRIDTTPVTESFTVSLESNGKCFVYDGVADITITIPEILTVDVGDGFTFCVDRKKGAGKITFVEAVIGSINLRAGDTLVVESGGVAQFWRRNGIDNSASLLGALVQSLQPIKMQSIDIGPIPAITDHDAGVVFTVKADVAYKFDAHLLSNFNAAVTTDLLQLHINFPDAEYSMSSVFIPDQAGGAPQVQRKHSDDGSGLFVIILRDSTTAGCANVTGYIKPIADGDLSIGFLVTNNDPAQTADIKRGYITLTEVG